MNRSIGPKKRSPGASPPPNTAARYGPSRRVPMSERDDQRDQLACPGCRTGHVRTVRVDERDHEVDGDAGVRSPVR